MHFREKGKVPRAEAPHSHNTDSELCQQGGTRSKYLKGGFLGKRE